MGKQGKRGKEACLLTNRLRPRWDLVAPTFTPTFLFPSFRDHQPLQSFYMESRGVKVWITIGKNDQTAIMYDVRIDIDQGLTECYIAGGPGKVTMHRLLVSSPSLTRCTLVRGSMLITTTLLGHTLHSWIRGILAWPSLRYL
jgi:hypothetical protein